MADDSPGSSPSVHCAGYAVVHGHRLPIVASTLWRGKFWFLAEAPGPLPAVKPGPVTIFGEDNRGVCQGPTSSGWEKVPAGGKLTLWISLRMDAVNGPDGETQ